MKESPRDHKKEDILDNSMKFLIFILTFTVGIPALLVFWHVGLQEGDLTLGRTLCFAVIGSVDLFYVFAFKNLKKPLIRTEHFFDNKYLLWGVAYGFLLLFAAIYLPFFNRILETVPLKPFYWLPVVGIAFIALLTIEFVKLFRAKKKK